jgi:deoxyribodipyrimidine photo-lyase
MHRPHVKRFPTVDDPPMHTLTPLLALDRESRIAQLAASLFGGQGSSAAPPPGATLFSGGQRAALKQLAAIDPAAYARTRNFVGGAVSRLSPWLRHGVLSLAEVRDAALLRVTTPAEAEKFIAELGWRDYWRQVQAALGSRIRHDIEPPAARWRRAHPLEAMPDDVLAAQTGLACIDAFVRRLHETGWLHNHERMWLASWLVHTRGVRWQTGADWFLAHLLDGDPASNHLSWQWVAGTFSAKPYIFNRENLERFTDGAHCRECPLLGECPLEGTYDDLAARWFAGEPMPREPLRIPPAPPWRLSRDEPPGRPLVWLTLDSLAVTSPAALRHPTAPRLFVLDPAWLAAEQPTLKRLVFVFDCLAEIEGVEVVHAAPQEAVPLVARHQGCDHVAVASTPCPATRAAASAIAAELPVHVIDEPPFCDRSRVTDLGRFSRYWSKVSRSALAPTPGRSEL